MFAVPHAFASPQPLVFAHRGGAKLAPENTMAAFERGLAAGADGLECDVHLSADGVPVVIHDPTLERTTDRTGAVRTLTADELARVDAGFHFGADEGHPFRGQGIGVPRFEDVLRLDPAVRVIVELKESDPALATAVVAAIRDAHAIDRVCVGSFYQRAVDRVRDLEPRMATSASVEETRWTLYRSWVHWPLRPARRYVAFQVPERAGRLTVVSPRFVRQAHREGQIVQAWVVDSAEDCRRLLEWGVDGLISDRPDIAVAVRDALLGRTRAGAEESSRRNHARAGRPSVRP